MSKRIESFADLIAPIDEDTFFAEYHDRKPLHIKAPAEDKLDDVMNWDTLTAILNMTAIWSPHSLKLVLDTNHIPPEQYCRQAVDRNGQQSLQPDADLVKKWLQRGASIVANNIDTLTPGLISAANALERRLRGKVQSNLYCSWDQHQAFPAHFDTHEVFALHVAGEKVWRIFEGRIENPIANETFKTVEDDFHEKNRGEVAEEVTLRPGDVLYIPRGQYHDALASSEGCIHLSFGVTHIIGFDVMTILFEQALTDPAFRQNIPLPEKGDEARQAWLDNLVDRLAETGRSEAFRKSIEPMREAFRYHRGGLDLPGDGLRDSGDWFRVTAKDFKVARQNGKALLEGAKGSVPIPETVIDPVSWIVQQDEFSSGDLAKAFPLIKPAIHTKLIEDLASMSVIARI